ncbi:MAG: glycosyltransferase family 2 protein, partial [Candidatus Omnitrophota bacterium]|nr:glycosyltransferase family 2 protein [Candidatus Omnitrophota bacterium]
EHIGSHEHMNTGAQIKYIYQENKGPAAARNNGIRAAKGDYVAFLDSDDIWLPKKLELEAGKMVTDSGYGLMHTDRFRMDLNGCIAPKRCIAMPEGFIFKELLRQNFICASSVLVKKECFTNVGLFDEDRNNRSEDYDMWLRIAVKYKIGSINEPLVKYRVNPSGFNRSMIKPAYDSERSAFLKALGHYNGDRERLKNKRLHGLMRRMGNSFLDVRDYREASYAFALAVKMNYFDLRSAGYYIISKLMDRLKT